MEKWAYLLSFVDNFARRAKKSPSFLAFIEKFFFEKSDKIPASVRKIKTWLISYFNFF